MAPADFVLLSRELNEIRCRLTLQRQIRIRGAHLWIYRTLVRLDEPIVPYPYGYASIMATPQSA